MKKDLLRMLDLTPEDIQTILDLADQLKYDRQHDLPHRKLVGKVLTMIFSRPSTRTRVSFEAGMFQLGGLAISLPAAQSQIGRGEDMADTARTLSRYCDGILMRCDSQSQLEELAKYATVPVINGRSDLSHPCQILGDLMTMREKDPILSELKVCYVGDGNNVASSLIVGGLKAGLTVSAACPEGYEPPQAVLDFAAGYPEKFHLLRDPQEAAEGADVLYTDVWTPMNRESERAEREKAFAGIYQINDRLLSAAKPGCMVMHGLPARKGEEITAEVFAAHEEEIFNQTENRLHVQKAILALLLGNG